jgi:CCCH-type zinc finger
MSNVPCVYHVLGKCSRGDKCRFSHAVDLAAKLWTQLCDDDVSCTRPECIFYHTGRGDQRILPPPKSTRRVPLTTSEATEDQEMKDETRNGGEETETRRSIRIYITVCNGSNFSGPPPEKRCFEKDVRGNCKSDRCHCCMSRHDPVPVARQRRTPRQYDDESRNSSVSSTCKESWWRSK